MDFVMELIFEIILEGVFGVTVHNQRIKLWVRTAIFIFISQIFTVLFAIGAASLLQKDDKTGYVLVVVAVVWCIVMLTAAIHGHRKGWPKNDI